MDDRIVAALRHLTTLYGTETTIGEALRVETHRYEHEKYLTALFADMIDMSEDALRQMLHDDRTPLDVSKLVSIEISNRPQRMVLRAAIMDRAKYRAPLPDHISEIPESIRMEAKIVVIEETREESDVVDLLAALDHQDITLNAFEKKVVATTLARVLASWKKPYRPYLASPKYSKVETFVSFGYFYSKARNVDTRVKDIITRGIIDGAMAIIRSASKNIN